MASSASSSSFENGKKRLGFMAHAMKRKDSFIQFFAITGILLLSMRSLGQKYRINDLQDENSALRDERDSLTERRNRIQSSLLDEAALDTTGLFASRLRVVFGNDRD